jgi:hypothetical protein
MAARTLNTLRKTAHSLIVGKGTFSVTPSSTSYCLLNKLNSNAIIKQQSAGYRAAVLHAISTPLVIEDVVPVSRLKESEVMFIFYYL